MPSVHVECVEEDEPTNPSLDGEVWDPSADVSPAHYNPGWDCGGPFVQPLLAGCSSQAEHPGLAETSGSAEIYIHSGSAETSQLYSGSAETSQLYSGSAENSYPSGFAEGSFSYDSSTRNYSYAHAGSSGLSIPVSVVPANLPSAIYIEDSDGNHLDDGCLNDDNDQMEIDRTSLLSCLYQNVNGRNKHSPFTTKSADLLTACSMHGIDTAGSFSTDMKQEAFLHHLLTGQCAHDSPRLEGCRKMAGTFIDQFDMAKYCLTRVATSTNKQMSVRRLHLCARSLGLPVHTRANNARRVLIKVLSEFLATYVKEDRVMDRISSEDVTYPLDVHSTFFNFERLTKPVLLNLMTQHNIQSIRYTATKPELRKAISEHFAAGECIANSRTTLSSESPGCHRITSTFPPLHDAGHARVVASDDPHHIQLLKELVDLSEAPLKRIMDVLHVEYNASDSVKQLRTKFRRYIRRREVGRTSTDESAGESDTRLSEIRSQWPRLVSSDRKAELIAAFKEATSSSELSTNVCMACSSRIYKTQSVKTALKDLDATPLLRPDIRRRSDNDDTVVDRSWLDIGCIPPVTRNAFCEDGDVLIDPSGVVYEEGEQWAILCNECYRHLLKEQTPPLSLANHMYLGAVPDVLQDLTVVEEAMIARCRAKSWIIQLKEKDPSRSLPINQRGFRGNIVVYPQEPSAVADVLPPSITDLCRPICVIFIGKEPPTREWLAQKAKPLSVRPHKVRLALEWLKGHNKFYKDLRIDYALLESLPDEYTLPVHVEHVLPDSRLDSLTSRYDHNAQTEPSVAQGDQSSTPIHFESVVITDVDGDASSNELKAAALRHIHKKGGSYVQLPHGPRPVSEFNNPALFPMIYPTLFPYGIGGFEQSKRTKRVSMQRQVKYLLGLSDRRFQEHYSFLFTAFNMFQRREILRTTAARIKRSDFHSFATAMSSLSPELVNSVVERYASGLPVGHLTDEEKRVEALMRQVNVVTTSVAGSSASRVRMRNELRALQIDQGLPSFYLTINPADVYNPVVRFLAGEEIDVDNILPHQKGNYWEQAKLIAKNPAVAANFFELYVNAFISALLQYSTNSSEPGDGILGTVKGYYGCVEAQGRGTLHCHMLIWVEGGLNPNEIKKRILEEGDEEFKRRLLAFLDDTISTSVPADPDPALVVPSSTSHPCSVRGVGPQGNRTPENMKIAREKDMFLLAQECQVHDHTDTCFKYCKKGEPEECQFHLDAENVNPVSFVDPATGEITLQCLDGLVNNYNATVLEAMRCNMDIKFIGSGSSAKAIVYYVTDYITKTQLKTHVAYAALESALRRAAECASSTDSNTGFLVYDDTTGFQPSSYQRQDLDPAIAHAKRLLQKCSFSIINHQELSAQQVMSYLLGFSDHYTSHKFRSFSWSPIEKFISSTDSYDVSGPVTPDEPHLSTERVHEEPVDDAGTGQEEDERLDHDEHVQDDDADNGYDGIDEEYDPPLPANETSHRSVVDSVEEYDGDVRVTVEDGTMRFQVGLLADYHFRATELEELCLWDAVSRLRKVRKLRPRASRRRPGPVDREDEMLADDVSFVDESGDVSDELELDDQGSDSGEDIEHIHDGGSDSDDNDEDGVQPSDVNDVYSLLGDSRRKRPRFSFKATHPEADSHDYQICSPRDRIVPVPIGQSIPRRDRPEVYERYCRLMLIFFKPWRTAEDLRMSGQSWSDAFEHFRLTCRSSILKLMDNMQLQHECKDSRDDHFSSRASRRRERKRLLRGLIYRERVSEDDDFFGSDDVTSEVIQHIESVLAARSTRDSNTEQDIAECLTYANVAGLFSNHETDHANVPRAHGDAGHIFLVEDHPELETKISRKYEERRRALRTNAMNVSIQSDSGTSPMEESIPVTVQPIATGPTHLMNRLDPFVEPSIEHDIEATDSDNHVDIDEFLNRYDPPLNKEQERSFWIVARRSLTHNRRPLRMFIGGPGGTGKSHVISALKAFFDERNQSRRFRLASFTGVAAKNIKGVTLHSTLLLDQRSTINSNSKSHRDLIAMWKGVDYLFIDEVSMIGCQLLLKVSKALGRAKQNSKPFGGINIIFAGDFAQLPPVRDIRLYAHVNTKSVTTMYGQNTVFGKLLWLSIDVVVLLDEVMRQSGDENRRFVDLLSRLRLGACDDDDYELLHSRVLANIQRRERLQDLKGTPIIVSGNKVKDTMNIKAVETFSQQVGRPVYWYNAVDKHRGKIVTDATLRSRIGLLHSGQTGHRMFELPLVIGMPVVIGQNFDVAGGVVNGTTGVLVRVRFKLDGEGNRYALSCVVKVDDNNMPPMDDSLHEGEVMVLSDCVQCSLPNPYSKKRFNFSRSQLPLMPGFVMTAHKAQGQTLSRVIVDLQTCRGTEEPYVMISRVKNLEGLFILRPFDRRKIQCRQSEDTRKEAIRLQFLRVSTLLEYGDDEEVILARRLLNDRSWLSYSAAHVSLDEMIIDEKDQPPQPTTISRLSALQSATSHLPPSPIRLESNQRARNSTSERDRHEQHGIENGRHKRRRLNCSNTNSATSDERVFVRRSLSDSFAPLPIPEQSTRPQRAFVRRALSDTFVSRAEPHNRPALPVSTRASREFSRMTLSERFNPPQVREDSVRRSNTGVVNDTRPVFALRPLSALFTTPSTHRSS